MLIEDEGEVEMQKQIKNFLNFIENDKKACYNYFLYGRTNPQPIFSRYHGQRRRIEICFLNLSFALLPESAPDSERDLRE